MELRLELYRLFFCEYRINIFFVVGLLVLNLVMEGWVGVVLFRGFGIFYRFLMIFFSWGFLFILVSSGFFVFDFIRKSWFV